MKPCWRWRSHWGRVAFAVIAAATCKPTPQETSGGLATVQVLDDVFSPNSIQVGVADSVRWHWGGVNLHDVVFEDGIGSSGIRVTGEHFRVFSQTGDYRFRCTQHSPDFASGMVGVIRVR